MTREPIYAALFALVSGAPGLITTSRKLQHWGDVPAVNRPALFQAQKSETAMERGGNMPVTWRLDVDLYVYVSTQGADSPGEVLNPIVDWITAVLDWRPIGAPQTLGGLVLSARVEGTIATDGGVLGDDAVAIVPVRLFTI